MGNTRQRQAPANRPERNALRDLQEEAPGVKGLGYDKGMRTLSCQMESPVGALRLASDGSGICRITFASESEQRWEQWLARHFGGRAGQGSDAFLEQACGQLKEYFQGRRRCFEIPLALRGTDFQVKVWQALLDIPFGQTWSYGQVGQRVGRPQGARAVGGAVGTNPVAIVVPCHRVIGKSGDLVGFGGGLDRKTQLLKLEGFGFSSFSNGSR